jgi:hypothetical protein
MATDEATKQEEGSTMNDAYANGHRDEGDPTFGSRRGREMTKKRMKGMKRALKKSQNRVKCRVKSRKGLGSRRFR